MPPGTPHLGPPAPAHGFTLLFWGVNLALWAEGAIGGGPGAGTSLGRGGWEAGGESGDGRGGKMVWGREFFPPLGRLG